MKFRSLISLSFLVQSLAFCESGTPTPVPSPSAGQKSHNPVEVLKLSGTVGSIASDGSTFTLRNVIGPIPGRMQFVQVRVNTCFPVGSGICADFSRFLLKRGAQVVVTGKRSSEFVISELLTVQGATEVETPAMELLTGVVDSILPASGGWQFLKIKDEQGGHFELQVCADYVKSSAICPIVQGPIRQLGAKISAAAIAMRPGVYWKTDFVTGERVVSTNKLSATARWHTCAIDDSGVKCWGYGAPLNVPHLTNPRMVSSGENYACAIDDTGVKCWGDSSYGRTDVPLLSHPTMVSAGDAHACAIDDTGVKCWSTDDRFRTTVPSLTNPKMVSAGALFTCAIHETGVKCWGPYAPPSSPKLINPRMVSVGYSHVCAIDDSGVKCWGNNGPGVTNMPSLTNPKMVSAGYFQTCAVDDNGVTCWGNNDYGQSNVPPLTNPTVVSTGQHHTCALDSSGVKCWGLNDGGQTNVPPLTFGESGPEVPRR